MNRLRMVLSESARSLTANLSTTVAATMTVLIGMFLLGLFIALGTWVLSWSDQAKDKLLVKVYMCTPLTCPQQGEATEGQLNSVRNYLVGLPEIRAVTFVSKEEALQIMKRRSPELVEQISSNPLPHAFEVAPRRAEEVRALSDQIRQAGLPGVEKVRDGEKVADSILSAAKVISAFFLAAVLVLAIAAALLIANTIRLSIFSRRREIEVMKLVGATNWFVRGPFMIEGLLCGLAGSLAAVLLLLLGKELVLPSILGRIEDTGVGALSFHWNALALVGVGLLLGALGSGMTLRRFLRV
ncbi:MAG: FtsX-like permease family protein [Thermoleophilia bacterium]|nr:FtsX-like permease family protein [Thermoleophilia bacterium]